MTKPTFHSFFNTLGEIESVLSLKYGTEKKGLNQLINTALQSGWIKKEDCDFLNKSREVRNIIAHTDGLSYLENHFEIKQETQLKLNSITESLKRVSIADDLCIKSVYTRSLNDNLVETIQVMRERNYTHVPILDELRRVIGVFSEDVFFNASADPEILAISQSTTIKKFEPYLGLEKSRSQSFQFIEKQKSIYETEKLFSDAISKKQRLSLLLVTETGCSEGSLIGIITIWDTHSPSINYIKQ